MEYKSFQKYLLDTEIRGKTRTMEQLTSQKQNFKQSLKELVSPLDAACLAYFVERNNRKYSNTITAVHQKKLEAIGGKLKLTSCNPDKVIYNFSDRPLTNREKFLLSFGLDFNLPVYKCSFLFSSCKLVDNRGTIHSVSNEQFPGRLRPGQKYC
jgi:hypothetical protein